mmetsp:Transcript_95264/g.274384  ORF Transcript_95264/g.274384 Transcript_95264/m.274384 type:complete len:247 (-) Transcript_95264:118-858(-)
MTHPLDMCNSATMSCRQGSRARTAQSRPYGGTGAAFPKTTATGSPPTRRETSPRVCLSSKKTLKSSLRTSVARTGPDIFIAHQRGVGGLGSPPLSTGAAAASTCAAPTTIIILRPISRNRSLGGSPPPPLARPDVASFSNNNASRISRNPLWASWLTDSVTKSKVRTRMASSWAAERCLSSDCAALTPPGATLFNSNSRLSKPLKNVACFTKGDPSLVVGNSCSARGPSSAEKRSKRWEMATLTTF